MAHLDINLISNALGRAVDITLILPTKTAPTLEENYVAKTDTYYQDKKNKKYPLLILLHGYFNDEKNWSRYARAELYAEENNIAIVMVNGENKFYMNSEALTTNDSFYDFIEYELKDFLYGTFPISSKREDNFIAGLSMGAFGALFHGLKNPKAYASIGAFSPVYKNDTHPICKKIKDMFDIKSVVGKKTDMPFIFLACGDKDILLPDSNLIHEELEELNIPHLYTIEKDYAHEWRFWDLELERFIKGLKRIDLYKAESPRGV